MSSIKGHRFHPFQRTQPIQPSSLSVIRPCLASESSDLQSSPLLNYLGYRFHMKHLVMICVACECAILSTNGLGHVKKKHDISVTREQEEQWNATIQEWNVTSEASIQRPTDRKPVELLKVYDEAFCCNLCSYACLTVTTFAKHWSNTHRSEDMESRERYHEGSVQTFYSHAPCIYFEVDARTPGSTPLFDIYLQKEIPSYSSFDVTIPSAPREIPPLLYHMRWHEHLADYITDKPKRRVLFSLAHPTKFTKDPLWKLVWEYLDLIIDVSKDSSMRVRCLLTEYPRTEQKAEPWRYHLTPDTQRLYAYPLHSLAYSILEAHRGHPSNYKFPLPDGFLDHIVALELCLQNPTPSDNRIRVIHDFIYPLLSAQPSIREENKWSMVIECWLSLYALQQEGNFTDASELTGVLAKLEYSCRAVTFYQGYLHRENFPDESLYLAVEHYCNLNIITGGLHPFNTIVEHQRFASALAYANASPPTTTLSADAKTVTYKDKTMNLDDWVLGMRKAYNDCIALVHYLCRGKDFSLDVPDDYVDNMSDNKYGYSWLDSVKGVSSTALMEHLMSNSEADVPCKMGIDDTLIWDAAWQISWMRKAGELNQLMANLHHTVPGQPSRIAELCDYRLRNGLRGRNVFYNHGEIWLITRRVKSESIVKHEEFIPVKLPPELCQLYKIYLIIIRPVEIDFARRLWGTETATAYHEYLYVGDGHRLMEDRFYVQFKRWTESYFKCDIGVRGYRQSIVVVARAYLGTEYELELEEEDDALIKQRGHGPLADRRCYGVQSAYLTTLSSDLMFRFGHMCEWWWRLTQFAPGKLPLLPLDLRRKSHPSDVYSPAYTTSVEVVDKSSYSEEQLEAMVSAGVATAIRSLKDDMDSIIRRSVAAGVAEVLARQISTPGTLLQQASFSLVHADTSMDVDTHFGSPTTQPLLLSSLNDAPVSEPMDIDSSGTSNKAEHYLRLFYKNKANPEFRSRGQKEMVEMAFAGTKNFIGVLPTGGGKSLVFLLPAFAATIDPPEDGLVLKTLVVIPNKSLMVDTMRKSLEAGVTCIQWTVNTNDRVIKDVALILIAIESLDSYKFKLWYRNNEKVVRRFIVDECHQVITCDSYRQKFNAVKELAQYPVQKIFITATLPVFLEDYFLQQVYLPRSTQVIREPTNRKNIIYHLLRVEQRVRKAKDVIVDLAKLVERELWNASSRGIIFCLSRADVDDLAPLFGNTKSHSDMESSDRLELQEKWNEGLHGHRWMVATTGFIHGIDHPNVDTVIFLEMPYGLNNFVQGGGRAGRSGRPAHVFLLDYCTTFMRSTIGVDSNAIVAGDEFVGNVSDCRRGILSEVMDGVRVCCGDLIDAEKCDLCNPNNPMVVASRKLLQPVRNDSPVYDEGGWDDTSYASIDMSMLDATPTSSSITPTTSTSSSITLGSSTSSSFTLASSISKIRPSASLLLDQAIYLKLKGDKMAKVLELTALTKAVSGIQDGTHVTYCVICWVWKNRRQEKTPGHQYFISCMSRDDGFLRHGFGWIQLKKQFLYEKYQYCWKCGLPQGEFSLTTHPVFRPRTILICPFNDLIVLLIWHIIHTEEIWKRACNSFSGIEHNSSLEEITKWLIKEQQPHLFYNGLELVIWFWISYKDTLL